MRRSGAIVLVLLVAAVAAAIALWPACDAPKPPAPPAPPVAAKPRTGPGGEIPAETRAPREPAKKRSAEPADANDASKPAKDGPVSKPARTLVVHVVGEDGADAQGARVLPQANDWAEKSVQKSETTDTAGMVRFDPYRADFALVLATRGDLAGIGVAAAGTIGMQTRIEVKLGPARRIRGVVLGRGELPVAGARVGYAWASRKPNVIDVEWEAVSTADGTFELPPLPHLPGGSDGYVTAVAAGYQPFQQDRHAADDGSEPIRIQLLPGILVKGRCVDERGEPVVRAEARWIGLRTTVESDSTGRFVLDGVPNHGVDLWITHANYAPGYVRHVKSDRGPDSEVDVGDVVLVGGGTVRGLFVDLENKPLAGALARLERGDGGETAGITQTGADGRFAFVHVASVPHTLTVTEGGEEKAWSARREAVVRGVLPDAGEVRVVLTGALGVHVRFLRDGDRSPVRVDDVKLEGVGVGQTDGTFGFGWSGDSAEIDGVRFEVRNAGTYRVEITIPGYAPAVIEKLDVLPDRETRIDVLFREPPK